MLAAGSGPCPRGATSGSSSSRTGRAPAGFEWSCRTPTSRGSRGTANPGLAALHC
ncbi:hypothetical protein ACFPRL_27060 [Pseudoclavibacter helvolus]